MTGTSKELIGWLVDQPKDIVFEIKKHRQKRSLNANAYCWVLCEKIANKTNCTKEDVYRQSIREIGVFKDFHDLSEKDSKTMRCAWEMLGTGWLTEQVDYMPDGEKVVIRCYYGSSQYNSKQMKRLIDNLIQDCNALDIETKTPDEIANLLSLWGESGE